MATPKNLLLKKVKHNLQTRLPKKPKRNPQIKILIKIKPAQ